MDDCQTMPPCYARALPTSLVILIVARRDLQRVLVTVRLRFASKGVN